MSVVTRVLLLSSAIVFALSVAEVGAGQKSAEDNVVIQWNEALIQAVRDSKFGPPMAARALAVVHTCMYDAWAAYDKDATGTRLGAALRRPANERKLANKREAVSYAAYRAARDLFPADADLFTDLIAALGYDPSDVSTDTATPQGIGNAACAAVLDFRHHDGANQLGDVPGGQPGVPYSDYTGYTSVNEPMTLGRRSTPHDSRPEPMAAADFRKCRRSRGTSVVPRPALAVCDPVRANVLRSVPLADGSIDVWERALRGAGAGPPRNQRQSHGRAKGDRRILV